MIKVAIVLNSAWQGYNFRLNLARALKANNYEVFFIAPEDSNYSNKLKQEFEFVNLDIKANSINPIDDLILCFSLHSVFKNIEPNVVLNFTIKPNIYSTIVAKMHNIIVINNITGLGTVFINKSFATRVVKILYKISSVFSHHIFFQNSYDRQLFLENKIVNHDKCSLIPGSGVDTIKFSPIEVECDGLFRFLLIGRVIKDKGIIEYIKAARSLKSKYPQMEFAILGELESENKTLLSKTDIIELQKEGVINFLGKTDQVVKEISKASCVVLPSYREGCPRSLLEASSMAVPVIASDVPGCNQVVKNRITGLLCKVKDSDSLALKMEEMYIMPKEERDAMGYRGRERAVDLFDESIVINRYLATVLNIYEKND